MEAGSGRSTFRIGRSRRALLQALGTTREIAMRPAEPNTFDPHEPIDLADEAKVKQVTKTQTPPRKNWRKPSKRLARSLSRWRSSSAGRMLSESGTAVVLLCSVTRQPARDRIPTLGDTPRARLGAGLVHP